MKTINSLSGGRTSSYMAVHYPSDVNVFALVEINDHRASPVDSKLIQKISDKIGHQFIATAEDDKTLILMFELEQIIGREITWLSARTFDSLFVKKHMFGGIPNRLPSWARRYCTVELKIVPIFEYCFLKLFESIHDIVEMRIGYRADEKHRQEQFLNSSNESMLYPLYCNYYGQRRQVKRKLNWRKGSFPLIDDCITNSIVVKYWQNKSLQFPSQSNCVGCFHKDPVSLKLQWESAPKKMQWFADQEKIGKGSWLNNKLYYEKIKEMRFTLPISYDMAGSSCSGGCTD